MNKHLYIILIVLIGFAVFTSSCSEEEEPDLISDHYYGEVTALKNGVEWRADPAGVEIKLDSVFTFIFDERNQIRAIQERFALFEVRASSSDEIENSSFDMAFNTWVDGDSLGDRYELIISSDNYIRISSYDPETKMVSGVFQASFVLTYNSQWTENTSDTVRFTDGQFWTQIVDISQLEPGDFAYTYKSE